MNSLMQRFRRCARGTTAVEFAVLAPVMILLIAGAIDMGRMVMIRSTLESAIGQAARDAMVNLTVSETQRDTALRALVAKRMSAFPAAPGKSLQIETKVFRDLGSSYPEAYEDQNGNGAYDPPSGSFPGEPFDDRNRNGVRDIATQQTSVLGGAGDVVSYTAVFPAAYLFGFARTIGLPEGITLTATVVLRNEPVAGGGLS